MRLKLKSYKDYCKENLDQLKGSDYKYDENGKIIQQAYNFRKKRI